MRLAPSPPKLLKSLLVFVFVFFPLALAFAQSADSQGQQESDFFESIAKLTYNMAWPTATYQRWNLAMPVKDADGGIDLVIKLSGLSGFDGSDLWLKLGFAFRGGKLDHVVVVDHNAIIMPPFKTMQALGALASDLARQYSQSHPPSTSGTPSPPAPSAPSEPAPLSPAPPPSTDTAMAVCVVNQIDTTVSFVYRWGDGAWSKEQLEAGKSMIYWYTLDGQRGAEPPFFIEYDDSFEDGYTPQRYELKRNAVSTSPPTCDLAKQYTFTASGVHIFLRSTN